jgi:cell division septal protein FtsQ
VSRPGPSAPQPPRNSERTKRAVPLRVRRRRTRLIALSAIVVIVIALVFGASYASYLPQYSIRSISVSGSQSVPTQLISQYAESIIFNGSRHFFSRANIFLYPRALIEKDIPLEFPRIESAQITRTSLTGTAITINVTERQPFALWCLSGEADTSASCYEADQTGFIFAAVPAAAASSTQYVFSGGIATSSDPRTNSQTDPIGQTFAPGHMPGLVVFLHLLGQAGFTPEGAAIQSDEDFTVPLAQGFYIDASFGQDAGQLVSNLQLILSSSALQGQEQNLEYVDLRFGDRVYFKLKGQSQQQASSTSAQ